MGDYGKAMPWLYGAGMGIDFLGGLIGGQGQHGIERRTKRNLDQQYRFNEDRFGKGNELWKILQNMQNNPTMDINRMQSAIAPHLNQYGNNLVKSGVSSDSGAFQGAMGGLNNSMLMDLLMRGKQNNLNMMLGMAR